MKLHFSTIDGYNTESGNNEEYGEPICGTYSENIINDWNMVTCKKCLKLKESFEKSMKRIMEDSIKYMTGFNEFMECDKKILNYEFTRRI